MPAEDVSDLKDVFDAINRLCETMKTSGYGDDEEPLPAGLASPTEGERIAPCVEAPESQFVSAEDLSIQRMETQRQRWMESQASLAEAGAQAEEHWSDCCASPPGPAEDVASDVTSDTEPAAAACGPPSDLYYTASSDVSLTDSEHPERAPASDKEEGKGVMAGHVAAMRERFESMTRANTPCPPAADSPLDLCRDVTPSPDLLG